MILHHQFIVTAKKFHQKTAIIDRTRDKRVSYHKALLASFLLQNTFKNYEGKYLGIMVPTSAGAMLSVLATLFSGKIPVMINYSTGAENNARYAQNKCKFETIITSRALLEKIKCPQIPGMICLEDLMITITLFDKIKALFASKRSVKGIIKKLPHTDEDDTAVILFTSGSEKDPKAVQLTHKNISTNLRDAIEFFNLTDQDSIMSMLPLFHVFGHSINFWLPMYLGMTAITYANPIDYKMIPQIVREEKPTMMAGTPIFFDGYLRESKPGDFASVRLMVAGADKTPDRLRKGYKEKHNLELLEGYGATETSPVISANRPGENRPGSIGKIFPSLQVKILDIKTDQPVAPGEEGKIFVKGDSVMKGYLDPANTAQALIDGWYNTGDIGAIDADGYLWHKGRYKRFIKIGGEMVSLVKTELCIEEILPDNVNCCVVDVPDKVKGAFLVAALTENVDDTMFHKELAKKLPPIAIPKKIIVFDELPKMGTGKADFRTITRMVREKIGA